MQNMEEEKTNLKQSQLIVVDTLNEMFIFFNKINKTK